MKKIIIGVLMSALVFTSCKKEEVEPVVESGGGPVTATKVEIGTATTSANETVTLYADNSTLTTGFTNLYVKVVDGNGMEITNATVDFAPLMTMSTMSHACPIEQPVFDSSIGKYKGALVFIMSSMAGTWTLDVNVNGNPASFTLTVAEAPTKVMGSYLGTDGATYIVSLLRPVTWDVGMNDVEFLIHKKTSMMSFPPVDDFTIVMTPEMVSMGHGSPNNVDPVFVGNGHYNGDVNYTMTGDWRLHLQLLQSGVEIQADAFLDILF